MIDFIKFSELEIPKAALELIQFDLSERYHLFDEFTLRQSYKGTAHAETKTIPLRLGKSIRPETKLEDMTEYAMLDEMEFEDWPIFKDENFLWVQEIVDHVMGHLNLKELGWVTIVTLGPDSEVLPHKDEGEYCKAFRRFHVCLYCKENTNSMIINKTYYNVIEGDVFTFNNNTSHAAKNISLNCERIHLIFDAR